ncbi:xanthine dehydrogenase family protein molybdopterin-binding subunit [Streptomyces sp. NBC_01799]|uniref:xanthine dehydrogenase family protein molybdopterin-binding subunit n=1 Tax=Streptomyces sp. NBC_01800 TaxID=2975945 RepID=UPI002DD7B3BD|nr:xanthine dehydrogenase family protein molybdopterin-binding subunit [Streptomyces sp. NBC_01800]WSA72140.1 xanthine dehydrogenase family protein molybdopterin-binding subunit [Streptomyces sp. NBC_01800]WSA80661.1 xanthine dehydrogenase family protein molybdopterin-binding subunit [Streptomyces sp. NBC_01799]
MIGQALSRVDGPLKVAGRATYAYENWGAGQPLYGFIVGATIGKGRITRIDTESAESAPGVKMVMTHHNAPEQGVRDESIPFEYWRAQPVLTGPDIHYYGEPVALVVATTLEQARAAADLVEVEYTGGRGRFNFAEQEDEVYIPKVVNAGLPTDTAVGDFDAGFDSAAVKVDQQYTTPYELSMPMEPHACLVEPRDEDLVVYVSCQIVDAARASVAGTLRIDPERVHIVTPFVGGGFGSKLGIHSETILAALAARDLRQPVKVAMTRQQIFQLVGNRPTSRQRVRLGAEQDGQLTAIAHDVTMHTNPDVEYAEQTAATTRSLYAAPHRLTSHRLAPLDLPPGSDVRAPGEAPGMLAVESAMDELAHALGMDPVELRILNEPTVDPERDVPYSDRHLVDCLREGARRFGWEHRPATPASVRDGRWLVGYGMSAAIRGHFQGPTAVRVRLEADGTAVVQTDMTDLGTGTYTVLTQVAAEGLGLPPDRVRIELGRSDFPTSWGSGGSWGATNSSNAVHGACMTLREQLLAAARGDTRSPLHGLDPADAVFSDGNVVVGGASEALTDIVARNHPEGVEAEGGTRFMGDDPNYTDYSINTYGAHFAEVGVDADTAEIRLRRMLGVFSVGRVLNAKTARSQLIGGMIWGTGAALEEEAVVDLRSGAFVNRDLAQYLVPVHADIPDVDAVILDGYDDKANVLGAKGVGELGICGAGASVANAVFNATGVRVRDFPITIEKVLPGLPLMDA